MNIEAVDAIAYSDRWAPRRGWHDDNRHLDRTPAYLPALMQVRSEFASFIEVLRQLGLLGGSCIQLGMGECDASHAAWRALFARVVTIDFRVTADNDFSGPGMNTQSFEARSFASQYSYDLLFIDAGHKLVDIATDHTSFKGLVRKGGIIAFHDACKRPGYEDEVDVWRYLEYLDAHDNLIGDEVGIAWIPVS